MTHIREFAPAKVNLTLEVLGKRADGFHELQSLVAFATDIHDVITLDTRSPMGVTTSGPFAASIAGVNLVATTLRLIESYTPGLQLGAVHLEKNLPVAAGIGGGSADAAAVLRAVRRANAHNTSRHDWNQLALKLGADVPVCLHAALSWMTGVGEVVKPIALGGDSKISAVIVNPRVAVPADKTAQVFGALGATPLASDFIPRNLPDHLTGADVLAIARTGRNSLEAVARRIVPAIDLVLEALSDCPENLLTRMSGAGPTCFALFASAEAAQHSAAALSAKFPHWWVRATALR